MIKKILLISLIILFYFILPVFSQSKENSERILLFERYLPYALALDVEQKWAEKFTVIFKKTAESGKEYSPTWYTSSGGSMGPDSFGSGGGGGGGGW